MNRTFKLVGMIALCASVLAASPVLAHGDKTHVMGTVTALEDGRMGLHTREGKSVSVRVTSDTKYRNGDAPAVSTDLKVGNRVMVDLDGPGENPAATDVRFSSGAKDKEGVPEGDAEHEHHAD